MIAALARLLGTTEQNAIDAAKSERGYRAAVSRRSFMAAGAALASGSAWGFGSMLAPVTYVSALGYYAEPSKLDGTPPRLGFVTAKRLPVYDPDAGAALPALGPGVTYWNFGTNDPWIPVQDGNRVRLLEVPR